MRVTVPPLHLGARASMLLGMLGHPMTAPELLALINEALGDDELLEAIEAFDELLSGTLGRSRVVLRSISDGGVQGVHRIPRRLERAGWAGRLIVDDDLSHDLWHRKLPEAGV